MTHEQQRIALCNFAGEGWNAGPYGLSGLSTLIHWLHSDGIRMLSDPHKDLNCVHELEKKLDGDKSKWNQQDQFMRELEKITGERTYAEHFSTCHATAAQRCEALLKTLGLWEETR